MNRKAELAWRHAEILKLAVEGTASAATTARITDPHGHVARGATRLAVLRNEVADLKRERLEPQHVEAALADFGNVWDALSPREKAQLLSLWVARVDFDAAESTIKVSIHPSPSTRLRLSTICRNNVSASCVFLRVSIVELVSPWPAYRCGQDLAAVSVSLPSRLVLSPHLAFNVSAWLAPSCSDLISTHRWNCSLALSP